MQKIVVVCRPRNRGSQLKTRKTLHLTATDGGHAVELSGTILAMAARLPHRVADGL